MNWIEILGWLATLTTIVSFIPKGEDKIRTINGIACIVWIVYGITLKQNPLIVVNGIVLILHIIYFFKKTLVKQNRKTESN